MRSRTAAASPVDGEQQQAVVKRMPAKRASLSHGNLEKQQQHHYDYYDNDNNNAPARRTAAKPFECYKQRTAIATRPATAAATGAQLTSLHQPLRSQPPRISHYHHHHHHYDCATDSDLTRSQLVSTNSSNNNINNYEQNILLFATEHQNDGQHQAEPMRFNAHRQHLNQNQQQQQARGLAQPRTGKFVSHYPSWRQTNSPTFYHQNYSFHVPLSPQQLYPPPVGQQQQQQQQLYRLRQGSARSARFKSRTIAHLPQYGAVNQQAADTNGEQQDHHHHHHHNHQRVANVATRHQLDDEALATKHYVLSEGDLLMAQQVPITQDLDNPFRPGTELSWEADMMVRLMKRGYPVQELPALVEAAKQVARHQSANSPQLCAQVQTRADKPLLTRRQSMNNELDATGQLVWASSLSRAKSAPRFADADSIDQLITSIENEMSDLLRDKSGGKKLDSESELRSQTSDGSMTKAPTRKSAANAKLKSRTRTKEQQVDRSQRKHSSSQGGNERYNASNKDRETATDLIKSKKRDNKCCAIH